MDLGRRLTEFGQTTSGGRALLLAGGVYVFDSMQTSSVANGEVATSNRTIVNWDVAKADWDALCDRAHKDWVRISSKAEI